MSLKIPPTKNYHCFHGGNRLHFYCFPLQENFQKPQSEQGLWLLVSTVGTISADMSPEIHKHLSGPSCFSHQIGCTLVCFSGLSLPCSTTEAFPIRIHGAEVLGPAMDSSGGGGLGKPPLPATGALGRWPCRSCRGSRGLVGRAAGVGWEREHSSSWWQELARQRPCSRPSAVRLLCL